MIKRAFLTVILAFVYCFPEGDQSRWAVIDNKYFSFQLPPGFNEVAEQGVDSYVAEYQSKEIRISFDYGMYSNDFTSAPKSVKFDTLKIDGKAAIVGWFKQNADTGKIYVSHVYFAKTSDRNEGNRLSMVAECQRAGNLKTAAAIFRTVKFKP